MMLITIGITTKGPMPTMSIMFMDVACNRLTSRFRLMQEVEWLKWLSFYTVEKGDAGSTFLFKH